MDRDKVSELAKTCTVEELTEAIKLKNVNLGVQDDPSVPEVLVEELELSKRVVGCLTESGVLTISDLARCTSRELLGIRGFGKVGLNEVKAVLAKYGQELLPKRQNKLHRAYDLARWFNDNFGDINTDEDWVTEYLYSPSPYIGMFRQIINRLEMIGKEDPVAILASHGFTA